MEIASGNSADQFLKKIAPKKAILIFSAILAKRGNLDLDLQSWSLSRQIQQFWCFILVRGSICFNASILRAFGTRIFVVHRFQLVVTLHSAPINDKKQDKSWTRCDFLFENGISYTLTSIQAVQARSEESNSEESQPEKLKKMRNLSAYSQSLIRINKVHNKKACCALLILLTVKQNVRYSTEQLIKNRIIRKPV